MMGVMRVDLGSNLGHALTKQRYLKSYLRSIDNLTQWIGYKSIYLIFEDIEKLLFESRSMENHET